MEDRATLVGELTKEFAKLSAEELFALRLCRAFTRLARAYDKPISLGMGEAYGRLLRRAEASGQTLTTAPAVVIDGRHRAPGV